MTPKVAPGDTPVKFTAIMNRRLEKGQNYHQPCMGIREFTANYQRCEEIPPCPPELLGERGLGFMLLDMDYSDPEEIKPMFYRAVSEIRKSGGVNETVGLEATGHSQS